MLVNHYDELIGKRLLNDILDTRGVMLVPAGTILLSIHIEKLENFQIELIDIQVEELEHEQQPLTEITLSDVKKALEILPMDTTELISKTEAKMQEINDYVQKHGKVPVAEIEEKVLPNIIEMSNKRNLYQLFSELKTTGDFRYKQSVGVAVIATMLGKWMKLDDEELKLLSTAASLYDIGSVKLPHSLLHKSTYYLPHEFEIVKQHTVMGHEILIDSGLDPRVALVALQHHERDDGSGYPAKLKGHEIDPLSKIVALADVYLAMISERPYRASFAFYQVINELHSNIVKNKFDPLIGMTFLNKLMASQIGSKVILSDDRQGQILLINANYPTSPLVALDTGFIDLSKQTSVKIKEIIG